MAVLATIVLLSVARWCKSCACMHHLIGTASELTSADVRVGATTAKGSSHEENRTGTVSVWWGG
eukprot:scaffold14833_cov221-Alexandrium_tamarense.AAC.4